MRIRYGRVLAGVVGVGLLVAAQAAFAQPSQNQPPHPPPNPPPNPPPVQVQPVFRQKVGQFQIEPNRLRWWQEKVPFFDWGQQPFSGDVPFGGMPLGGLPGAPDTIVRRLAPQADVTLPVPIEIVQLDLRSVEPGTVAPLQPPEETPPPKLTPEEAQRVLNEAARRLLDWLR